MISFIQILIDNGFAYETTGGVYFNVRKYEDYGKLSGQSLDDMEEGARVALDKSKKDPLDFALWKASKENEPFWESPWGKGRPGWHIECSVMSTQILKDKFVIHGGGLDLIFPHHENEIAQTVCAGKQSAKYWIHNGLLTIDKQKMSKSLGNFITIKTFRDRYSDMDLLKLLFLHSHYRHAVDYTEEKIEEMKRNKDRILGFLERVDELSVPGGRDEKQLHSAGPFVDKIKQDFVSAMDDDFNTPVALSVIFNSIDDGNRLLSKDEKAETCLRDLFGLRRFLRDTLSGIFGFSIPEKYQITELTEHIKIQGHFNDEEKQLVKKRDEARRGKDFKTADEVRKVLLEKGIVLRDTGEGTICQKKG